MSQPIRQDDFIQSIADAFQFISCYHPLDYIQALGAAYEREESPAAKDAIAQILTNSRMWPKATARSARTRVSPLVFLKVGMNVRWDATMSVTGHGQRRRAPRLSATRQPLRASVLPTRPARARIRRTTRRPWSITKSCRRPRRSHLRRQGRRLGKQIQVGHAEPVGRSGRLDTQDGADHGRRLVPAGHPGHRHRRHAGKGHAAGQGIHHGAGQHPGPERRRRRKAHARRRTAPGTDTRRSMRWASAPRAWAA
jgi:hypothetical protein